MTVIFPTSRTETNPCSAFPNKENFFASSFHFILHITTSSKHNKTPLPIMTQIPGRFFKGILFQLQFPFCSQNQRQETQNGRQVNLHLRRAYTRMAEAHRCSPTLHGWSSVAGQSGINSAPQVFLGWSVLFK